MDLNLYLGFARSIHPQTSDIGSDLALGPVPAPEPMSTSPSDEEYSPSYPFYDPPDPPATFNGPDDGHVSITFPESSRRDSSGIKLESFVEEEEKEQKPRNAANFECNNCSELAKEPVLTPCGHLFCWPCLYHHLHGGETERKDCPLCENEVTERNIVPIYGRGSSESETTDSTDHEIPPRPRGNRLESFRQKHRPMSRRLREGIFSSWRRLVSQQLQNRNPEFVNGDPAIAALSRIRARRMAREGENSEESSQSPDIDERMNERMNIWNRFSVDRLASLAADIRDSQRASSSYVDPEIPPTNLASSSATDQASGSSTLAVIEEEAEPNSAGSSRAYRRRERSSGSVGGSLDADEGDLHARKRRN